jgi:hypothetical protein
MSEQDWQDRKAVKKGNLGELYCDELTQLIAKTFLQGDGWISYKPNLPGPHKFDRIFVHRDHPEQIPWDIKTKPRRENYRDTGINESLVERYRESGKDFLLIFADEAESMVYGNWLSELLKERTVDFAGWTYPASYQGITYFPLSAMIPIATLSDAQCAELKKYRDSHYERTGEPLAYYDPAWDA